MSDEIHKFTKYWFLIGGIVSSSFAIIMFFFSDWFLINLQQYPIDDPGMRISYASGMLVMCTLGFFSFFQNKWSAVKIPLFAWLVWTWSGAAIMIYVQYGIPNVHNWNWFNTVAYMLMGIGSLIALILQLRFNKSESVT